MASKYIPGKNTSVWWVKFTHPVQGERLRFSLQTRDAARAEVLRRQIEHEVELSKLKRLEIPLPEEIAAALGLPSSLFLAAPLPEPCSDLLPTEEPPTPVETTPAEPEPLPTLAVPSPIAPSIIASAAATMKPLPIEDAIRYYLTFIRAQNDSHHVQGRVSQLRAFFGTERVDPILTALQEAVQEKVRTVKKRVEPGHFKGATVQEVTPGDIMTFLTNRRKADKPLSRVTKAHYREMFHQFFEVLLSAGLIPVGNLHTPNPMAALPSYGVQNRKNRNNRKITFLNEAQIAEQLAVLHEHPALEAAVMIMIYGGLRRAEALWRTVADISDDFQILRVVNLKDVDTGQDSSLKTGERNVAILPPLAEFLRRYVPTLKSQWLIPQPNGRRWHKDNFSSALRMVNEAANLPWRSMDYRHTYATARGKEGWPIFDIAHQMGTSVQMVILYYAAFIHPSYLSAHLAANSGGSEPS